MDINEASKLLPQRIEIAASRNNNNLQPRQNDRQDDGVAVPNDNIFSSISAQD